MTLFDVIGVVFVIVVAFLVWNSMTIRQGENRKLSPIYIPIRDGQGRRKMMPPPEEEETRDPFGIFLIGILLLTVFLSLILHLK